MAKLTGEGMAVMEPLPRRDAPSCRGAIFCARTFNALSDSGIQHGGGIEGRAQNIAPLQLIRCLIVECGGMEPCVPTCGDLPQPTLSEAHRFGCGGLQAALQASPSLAWSCPRYAISDGGFLFFSIHQNTPRRRKKTCVSLYRNTISFITSRPMMLLMR